jgi:hypothetical protein
MSTTQSCEGHHGCGVVIGIIIIIASTPPKIIAPPFDQSVTTASPPPPIAVFVAAVGRGVIDGGIVDQAVAKVAMDAKALFVVRRQHHHHSANAAENHCAPVRAINSIVILRAIIIPPLPTDRWRRIRVGGL